MQFTYSVAPPIPKSLPGVSTEGYFSAIRNFRREGWLLLYLFGASPALCDSFVAGREHGLQRLSEHTLYLPHATSLRMGRLGYQSDAQASIAVSWTRSDAAEKRARTDIKHLFALITDARFSGVSTGPCIGHIGPEALEGGDGLLEDMAEDVHVDEAFRCVRGRAHKGRLYRVGSFRLRVSTRCARSTTGESSPRSLSGAGSLRSLSGAGSPRSLSESRSGQSKRGPWSARAEFGLVARAEAVGVVRGDGNDAPAREAVV